MPTASWIRLTGCFPGGAASACWKYSRTAVSARTASSSLFPALKVCFLANLPQPSVCAALLAVPTAARFGVLIGIFQFPYVRQQGLGQAFVQYAPRRALVKAFLCALLPLAVAGWGYFLLLGAAMLISLGLNTYIARRLGGVTGDTYGAVIELSEMLLLGLAFLASGAVQTACIWI